MIAVAAQTDVANPSAEPSTDDFLAREKAILGDDADNFATADDDALFQAGGDDDLLGGGDETAQFESQFPDLSAPNQVRVLQCPRAPEQQSSRQALPLTNNTHPPSRPPSPLAYRRRFTHS